MAYWDCMNSVCNLTYIASCSHLLNEILVKIIHCISSDVELILVIKAGSIQI